MTDKLLAAIKAWQSGDIADAHALLLECSKQPKFLEQYLALRPPSGMGRDFFTTRRVGDKFVCGLREPTVEYAN